MKWKPKLYEEFYYISDGGGIIKGNLTCGGWHSDELMEYGNYFRTRREAQQMAKKIKVMLKGG